MNVIGLLMLSHEDDILGSVLQYNAPLVDAFYVLDGTTPNTKSRALCEHHFGCLGYWHDSELPEQRYGTQPRDGWRQHLLEVRRLDIHAQHNLRINLKKLRYAAEFFLPLYASHAPAKRYVKRLAGLQTSLGRVCDIGSTRVLLHAIRQDDQPALHLGIGAMAGWLARDQIAVAKTLRKSWRRFKTTPAFWGR